MNAQHLTGLGRPQIVGKHALFQPPVDESESEAQKAMPQKNLKKSRKKPNPQVALSRRVRTTIDLTGEALQIIQQVQQEHRLRTGKVLPLWKAVSQAITAYGEQQRK